MTIIITPEEMTADHRRQSWFDRELTGYGYADWEYGDELIELLTQRFLMIEMIFGKTNAAPHLFAMLPGPNIEGSTWEEALELYQPSISLCWDGAALIDNAGIYGLYGVTPRDVPFEARSGWIDNMAMQLSNFRNLAQPDPQRPISRIINLALSRHAIDRAEGEVDVVSLATFGSVSEGRIRNLLSSGDGGLAKAGDKNNPSVTAVSAGTWLKGRKEFFASIWQQPDEASPEAPSSDFSEEIVFVPVAADGSHFHPGLARGGRYSIGAKDQETRHDSFDDALAELHKMAVPRWRRPNEAGNWGIVSGREWKRIERHHLKSV
jgi:hypothetical protein